MIPFAAAMLGTPTNFTSYSVAYTTVGNQSVAVPTGATFLKTEIISGGNSGTQDSLGGGDFNSFGGSGGGYSKTNATSLAGISAIYITVPDIAQPGVVRLTNVGGTVICSAILSGNSGSGVGDVRYDGGAGWTELSGQQASGGGAAGPNGDGFPATGRNAPGAGNGSPAGMGGNATTGALYGSGGGVDSTTGGFPGRQGWVRLTWS